ncbi:homeobox protein [Citreicella sp. SE45]|nr:homeobox protein [Citreicella sp. SE45]
MRERHPAVVARARPSANGRGRAPGRKSPLRWPKCRLALDARGSWPYHPARKPVRSEG